MMNETLRCASPKKKPGRNRSGGKNTGVLRGWQGFQASACAEPPAYCTEYALETRDFIFRELNDEDIQENRGGRSAAPTSLQYNKLNGVTGTCLKSLSLENEAILNIP